MVAMFGLGLLEIVIIAVVLLGIAVVVGAVVAASTSRKDGGKPEQSSNAGMIITIVLAIVVLVVLACGGLVTVGWFVFSASDPIPNQMPTIIDEDRINSAPAGGEPLPPDTVEESPNE